MESSGKRVSAQVRAQSHRFHRLDPRRRQPPIEEKMHRAPVTALPLAKFSTIFTVRLYIIQRIYCQGISVRLSVRLLNACIVTKRKKLVPTLL